MRSWVRRLVLLCCLTWQSLVAAVPGNWLDVSVTDYGATAVAKRSQIKVLSTDGFQKAINAVARAGGGTVRVPPGYYFLSPVNLTSNLLLWLERGSRILADTDRRRMPVLPAVSSYGPAWGVPGRALEAPVRADYRDAIPRHQALFYGADLDNVTIAGENGTIDGQGIVWWERWLAEPLLGRPHLIQFERSTNLRLYNVTLRNPAFWSVHYVHCNFVHVRFLTILVPYEPSARPTNTDGINPDSTSNVLIEDSYLQTGDDSVAVKSGWDCYGRRNPVPSANITIRRVVVRQTIQNNAAGVAIGSEMSGGVHNVTIEDCHFIHVGVAVEVKVGTVRGGYVRDIVARRLVVGQSNRAAMVVMASYPEQSPFCYDPNPPAPVVQNIAYEDVEVRGPVVSGVLVQLQGAPIVPLSNIKVRGIRQSGSAYGWWQCSHVTGSAADNSPAACPALAGSSGSYAYSQQDSAAQNVGRSSQYYVENNGGRVYEPDRGGKVYLPPQGGMVQGNPEAAMQPYSSNMVQASDTGRLVDRAQAKAATYENEMEMYYTPGMPCTRPRAYCTSPGMFYFLQDCDGDGISDLVCMLLDASKMGYLGSASKCRGNWPDGTCGGAAQKLFSKTYGAWRNDGRCGLMFPTETGQPAACPTLEQFVAEQHLPARMAALPWLRNAPCCSRSGWCGSLPEHCCEECPDYTRQTVWERAERGSRNRAGGSPAAPPSPEDEQRAGAPSTQELRRQQQIILSNCRWRQTGSCNAKGQFREKGKDQSCHTKIGPGFSGYCDCNGNDVLESHERTFGCTNAWKECVQYCRATIMAEAYRSVQDRPQALPPRAAEADVPQQDTQAAQAQTDARRASREEYPGRATVGRSSPSLDTWPGNDLYVNDDAQARASPGLGLPGAAVPEDEEKTPLPDKPQEVVTMDPKVVAATSFGASLVLGAYMGKRRFCSKKGNAGGKGGSFQETVLAFAVACCLAVTVNCLWFMQKHRTDDGEMAIDADGVDSPGCYDDPQRRRTAHLTCQAMKSFHCRYAASARRREWAREASETCRKTCSLCWLVRTHPKTGGGGGAERLSLQWASGNRGDQVDDLMEIDHENEEAQRTQLQQAASNSLARSGSQQGVHWTQQWYGQREQQAPQQEDPFKRLSKQWRVDGPREDNLWTQKWREEAAADEKSLPDMEDVLRGLEKAAPGGGPRRFDCRTMKLVKAGQVTPLDFGALGDGTHDDTEAVRTALLFANECRLPVLIGPIGSDFLVQPGKVAVQLRDVTVTFESRLLGPPIQAWNPRYEAWAKGSCTFGELFCQRRADGRSPEFGRSQFPLLHLINSSRVTLQGKGTAGLQAPGRGFWKVRNRYPEVKGYSLLKIERCWGVKVTGLTLRNSPMYQLVIMDSFQVSIDAVTVFCEDSSRGEYGPHNTDAINIIASQEVHVRSCTLHSGDDNLVIKEGSRGIYAENLLLVGGKGISIGSLGEQGAKQQVVMDVLIKKVRIKGSVHGARIKTWLGGRGLVRNVTFEDMELDDVRYGLKIDQNYCPASQRPEGCGMGAFDHYDQPAVALRDITFKKWTGKVGAKFGIDCHRCSNVLVDDLNMQEAYHARPVEAWSTCDCCCPPYSAYGQWLQIAETTQHSAAHDARTASKVEEATGSSGAVSSLRSKLSKRPLRHVHKAP
eukprot:TRINITY_DN14811_c0_g2_i1.p1 TRINITY_DN14811_c0_g2~~TRINITY_DN14811_c0_g2_i1.p1  ORF type:complete len:1654 (-),score=279.46 TRINITY_DN14811_c0_g2_i1:344-5305(-)